MTTPVTEHPYEQSSFTSFHSPSYDSRDADNEGSDNDSVYSQPPNSDFYGQLYDAHNSSQLYPSRMDNSSTEGIKSVRDNHSMRSGSVLTDMAPQLQNGSPGSAVGSPRSIAKSVGWHSVGSRSPKSIKSTDSLKSGIVGNSWRRRDYYKFLTDDDSDGSIVGDADGPPGSSHVRIDPRAAERLDSRGATHPHSPLAQSHSSSLMFDPESSDHGEATPHTTTATHPHSNLSDPLAQVNADQDPSSSLHGLGVSMEALSVNGDESHSESTTESERNQTPRSLRSGIAGQSTNPNAAARSTSYSSSLSTSGIASPSIMSQNSDGASTSYTVPSAMHHVHVQHQAHQPQNLHVNTVPNLDNASIITLASSSKRRRRRSVDTMASTRGIAPASLYVNRSVESLPMDTDTETNHSVER